MTRKIKYLSDASDKPAMAVWIGVSCGDIVTIEAGIGSFDDRDNSFRFDRYGPSYQFGYKAQGSRSTYDDRKWSWYAGTIRIDSRCAGLCDELESAEAAVKFAKRVRKAVEAIGEVAGSPRAEYDQPAIFLHRLAAVCGIETLFIKGINDSTLVRKHFGTVESAVSSALYEARMSIPEEQAVHAAAAS